MNYTQQSGRSMIEMLGVLAIIGVLSVGGIAGYSQAMSKFKVTKTSDQIQTMVTNIRTLFASQKNYASVKTGSAASQSQLLYSVGILTDEMCPGGGNACTTPVNPYAGSITLTGSGTNNKLFSVSYAGLTADACVRLATQDWGDASSGLVSIKVEGGTAVTKYTNVAGDLPMTLAVASGGCGISGSSSVFTLTYR